MTCALEEDAAQYAWSTTDSATFTDCSSGTTGVSPRDSSRRPAEFRVRGCGFHRARQEPPPLARLSFTPSGGLSAPIEIGGDYDNHTMTRESSEPQSHSEEPAPIIGYFSDRFFSVDGSKRALAEIGALRPVELSSSALADCDILCAYHGYRMDAAVLARAERAALIVHPGSAVLCDLPAATELGIAVVHFPGPNAQSVAEHTVALMLALAKGLLKSDHDIRAGRSWSPGDRDLMRVEMKDKVLGLVGFGKVGAAVAQIASAGLGMNVRAWTRREEPVTSAGVEWVPDLDDLLSTSDVVSIHLALNPETENIVNRRRVQLISPHAILVNTARAAIVDCEAVAGALRADRIGGAAFDVWPNESPDGGFALVGLPQRRAHSAQRRSYRRGRYSHVTRPTRRHQ